MAASIQVLAAGLRRLIALLKVPLKTLLKALPSARLKAPAGLLQRRRGGPGEPLN